MNIYQGETIDMVLRFLRDDGVTPAGLRDTEVSVAVKDSAGRMACAFTTRDDDSYGDITVIDDSKMVVHLTDTVTRTLRGQYTVEIKVSTGDTVMIEQTRPITVIPSAIGKEDEL